MQQQELIPHLFRNEYRKITSVLCKAFGIDNIDLAEDVAGETFLSALETWPYKGIPENPTAWLYSVAKNKAINQVKRNKKFTETIVAQLKHQSEVNSEFEIDMSDENIADSQLQMLFSICHPSIAPEAQVALALRILCGFGIEEIANAFLTSKETINKRIYRAKEKLRVEKVRIEFPGITEVKNRLESVLTTLYLLFNEGYYSESQDIVLREDLCFEAMRLTKLLIDNKETNLPHVNALLSLMCFHSSRFMARKSPTGELILFDEQDESKWNYELITNGMYFLTQASQGDKISRYHLEATIAYWHTIKADTKEKWENILQLYNQLLMIYYSPVAALNRTYALSKVNGKREAITEAEKLQLTTNPYYFTLLGELYKDIDNAKAIENLNKAYDLANTQADKRIVQKKLSQL